MRRRCGLLVIIRRLRFRLVIIRRLRFRLVWSVAYAFGSFGPALTLSARLVRRLRFRLVIIRRLRFRGVIIRRLRFRLVDQSRTCSSGGGVPGVMLHDPIAVGAGLFTAGIGVVP